MRKYVYHILFILAAALLLTGCYRNDVAEIHNGIDDLGVRSTREQIGKISSTITDLRAVDDWILQSIEQLNSTREDLHNRISALDKEAQDAGPKQTEIQAELVSLQLKYDELEMTVSRLNNAGIVARIGDLETLTGSAISGFDDRMAALEALPNTLATLDMLAGVQASLDAYKDGFDSTFVAALRDCVDEVAGWVSESETMKEMFSRYYTKAEIDEKIAVLDSLNLLREEELKDLQSQVNELNDLIPGAIAKAIEEGPATKIRELQRTMSEISIRVESLQESYNSLNDRVIAMEELAAVVGDFSEYKGNLIADILALQDILGSEDKDNTLLSNVNVLKTLLVSSFGTYYDLAEIVSNLARNTSDLAHQDSVIQSLESLAGTLAKAADMEELADSVSSLLNIVDAHSLDIVALTAKVDGLVARWSDVEQIHINRDSIAILNNEKDKLWFAVGSSAEGNESGIFKLIADINVQIGLIIAKGDEHSADINKYDRILKECEVGEFTGLQECLDNLDNRIKSIWDFIGTGNLEIGADIIDAINKLNAKFGVLGDSTIIELIDALRSDIPFIKGEGWAAGLDLSFLGKEIDKLKDEIDSKADAGDVQELHELVNKIQKSLGVYITSTSVNDTLKNYITGVDAAGKYALLEDFDNFYDTYITVVGEELNPAEGTVLAQIRNLYNLLGPAPEWTSDLTTAVNILHGLVGDKSVSEQSAEIAQGFVDKLVNGILGYDGKDVKPVKDIADLLKKFGKAVDEFEALSVELGEKTYDNTQLDKAIEQIYSELIEYVNDDNCDIARGGYESLKVRLDAMDARHSYIESVLGSGIAETYGSVKDALDSLSMLFGAIGKDMPASSLIANLQAFDDALVNALLGYEGNVSDIDPELSLTSLRNRLDTLGFSDMKFDEEKTLADVIGEVTASISKLFGTIGEGFGTGEGNTVADALKAFKESLGTFSFSVYSDNTDYIDKLIQDLLDAIANVGEGAEGTGGIADIVALVNDLNDLEARFSSFGPEANRSLEQAIEDLNSYVDGISRILGDFNGSYSTDTTSISREIKALKDMLDNYKPTFGDSFTEVVVNLGEFNKAKNEIKDRIGFSYKDLLRLFPNPGGLFSGPDDLRTNSQTIVGAINELLENYYNLDMTKASLSDLAALKLALLGVENQDELTYKTIKALNDFLTSQLRQKELGIKPGEFADADIYSALERLEQMKNNLLAALGTNTTGFGSVWGAISALSERLLGQLGSRINSLVYIPEYDDRKATINSNKAKTYCDPFTLYFYVNATPVFAKLYGSLDHDIKGYVRTSQSYDDNEGRGSKTLNGRAQLDQTSMILTVRFSPEEIMNNGMLSLDGNAEISVSLQDANGDAFMSEYIPIVVDNGGNLHSKRIKSSDLDNGTIIKFAAGVGGTKKVQLTAVSSSDNLSDIGSASGISDLSVSGGTLKSITASSSVKAGDSGTVKFDDGHTTYTYPVQIVNGSTEYTIISGKDMATKKDNVLSIDYNSEVVISFDLEGWNVDGSITSASVTMSGYTGGWGVTSSYSNNSVTITTGNKQGIFSAATYQLTVKVGDNTLATITINHR